MLRPAVAADIRFIRSLTTRPDYAPFISDSDDAQLQVWIDSPSDRVLIWETDAARGFAVVRDTDRPGGIVELFRIALDRAGGGQGADVESHTGAQSAPDRHSPVEAQRQRPIA